MNDQNYEKYNHKRKQIKTEYGKKKLVNVFVILGTAAIAVILIALLTGIVFNIAVTLVLSVMIIMIAIIFTRIRVVTINHIMQQRLLALENEDVRFI